MIRYVNVNSKMIPVIPQIRKDQIMGIKRGSVLIVAHDCDISEDTKQYLDSKKVKIFRLDD